MKKFSFSFVCLVFCITFYDGNLRFTSSNGICRLMGGVGGMGSYLKLKDISSHRGGWHAVP